MGLKVADVSKWMFEDLIKMLESGKLPPWTRPWKLSQNPFTGTIYRGANAVVLQCKAEEMGFRSPYWMTFKKIKDSGGSVVKGEHGSIVVKWKFFNGLDDELSDEEDYSSRPPMILYHRVFNLEQTSGVEMPDVSKLPVVEHRQAEDIFANMPKPPHFDHKGVRYFYRPSTDEVVMVGPENFGSMEQYYMARFHEYVHSTMHPTRLHRKNLDDFDWFGSHAYSREELVAEFGAGVLGGYCGFTAQKLIENVAAYIQSWLRPLREDPAQLMYGMNAGQRAAEWIMGVVPAKVTI